MTKLFKCLMNIPIMILCCTLSACVTPQEYSAQGTVTAIEQDKDGYTAVLKAKNGVQYQAVISRINLAKPDNTSN